LILKNTGDETEPLATLTLPIPDGATLANATDGAQEKEGRLVWEYPNLAAGGSRQVCAVLNATQPGPLSLASTAQGSRSPPVQSHCQTRVIGIPAVLLQVVDINDPVEVGAEGTYEISVFNQGTAVLTNVGLACTLADQQQFLSGTGATAVQAQEQTITVEKLSVLKPKETAVWRVTVKALASGDVRFITDFTCDQFQTPIRENEATQQY
jgi:uncharacterized repeat protein (TIGR01451 family)